MGIRMLLNECEHILRGDQDNIEKAASEIPDNGFSILLSHTPEIYRQAAHGGFDLFVSGHGCQLRRATSFGEPARGVPPDQRVRQ